jgi:hypothetical protein
VALGTLTARTSEVGTTAAVTTPSFTVPAGDLILVAAGQRRAGLDVSDLAISDSIGLTWYPITPGLYNGGSNSAKVQGWGAISTGAAMTVTVTPGANAPSHIRVAVSSCSGAKPNFTNVANGGSGSGDPSATISAVASGSYVVGFAQINGASAISPPAGFTELSEIGGGSHEMEVAYDDTSPSTTMTWNNSGFESVCVVFELTTSMIYSTALAAGSYALTGSAMTPKRGWTVPLAAGSYNLAGSAVALRSARGIALAAGSYVQTGTAIALKRGYAAVLAAGAYVLTPTALALRVSRRLELAEGAYSYTGSAVATIWSRVVALGAGSYLITGSAVALSVAYHKALDAGAYLLSGSAATFQRAAGTAIDAGSYAVTGSAAGLKIARTIVLAAGAYAYEGSSAVLARAARTVLAAGAYVLTGAELLFEIFRPIVPSAIRSTYLLGLLADRITTLSGLLSGRVTTPTASSVSDRTTELTED